MSIRKGFMISKQKFSRRNSDFFLNETRLFKKLIKFSNYKYKPNKNNMKCLVKIKSFLWKLL